MGKRRGWDGMAGKEKEGRVGGRGRGREGRGKGRGCGGAQKVVCPGARAGSRRAWGGGEEKREGMVRAIKTPPPEWAGYGPDRSAYSKRGS